MISSGRLSDRKAKPKTDGNGYCDIKCPFFYDPGRHKNAKCTKDGKEIMFHDWHLAHCKVQ